MKNLSDVKYGIFVALITLAYGFGLGGAFGAFEHNIKDHLQVKGEEVLETVYKGDKAKMEKTVKKSWVYFKRAHLHANGLGTTALVLILLVSVLSVDCRIKTGASLCLGFGSLGYSMFWMFAGLTAPGMGSTGMAKESLKWMAVPSAGLNIMGLGLVVLAVLLSLFIQREASSGNDN